MTTDYRYDALDNLRLVGHGACPNCQQLYFTYDSLSRLASSSNPESGTVHYEYDAANNLMKKTDNRNFVTSYEYDALNRLTRKQYSDVTPPVNWICRNADGPLRIEQLARIRGHEHYVLP